MISIITGEIDSGKTRLLRARFETVGTGDGFLVEKTFSQGVHTGQVLKRLATGEERPFSFKEGFLPPGWRECLRFDVYSFCCEGFVFADAIAREVVERRLSPVFVDEVGPLELKHLGFYRTFSFLLSRCEDIYVAVRKSCLGEVVREFGIEEFNVIETEQQT